MGDLVKTVTMRILADAGDAQAKLDELTARADALGAKDIRVGVRVDAPDLATLETKLAATRAMLADKGLTEAGIRIRVDGAGAAIAQLTAVKKAADDVGNAGGGIFSKLLGLFGGGGGGGGLMGLLGKFGGGAIGPIPLASGLPGLAAGAGVIAGIFAALPALDALLTGGAAALLGGGAFGIMSKYAYANLQGPYGQLNTAQTNLQNAQALYQVAPTAANKQALTQAADQLKAVNLQISQLPAAEQAAITGMQNLTTAGGKLQAAFQPTFLKVFNDGLQVMSNLLPTALPFATTFGNVLDGVLKKVAQITAPPPGAPKISDTLRRMLNPDEVTALQPKQSPFQKFMDSLHSIEGPALNSIVTGIGKVAAAIGGLFTIMSGKDIAHTINAVFDAIALSIRSAGYAVKDVMLAWHALQSAGEAVARYLVSVWSSFERAVASNLNGVRDVVRTVEETWQGLVSAAQADVHAVMHAWDSMVGFLSSIPGKIKGFFADAGSWLLHAGESIIGGLVSGIRSAAGGMLHDVLSWVKSLIPSWKGPPEVDRMLLYPAGQAIMGGLVAGIGSQVPVLHAQLAGITGTIGAWTGTRGGGYAAGGGGPVNMHFYGITTDQNTVRQLVQALQEYKRHGGGSALGLA